MKSRTDPMASNPAVAPTPGPRSSCTNVWKLLWLVCESPWRGSRYRVRVAETDRPGLHRLNPTMLQELDDRLVSAQLPRLELVRSNPEERVNHRFANTIAGVVLVKLPPVLAASALAIQGRCFTERA